MPDLPLPFELGRFVQLKGYFGLGGRQCAVALQGGCSASSRARSTFLMGAPDQQLGRVPLPQLPTSMAILGYLALPFSAFEMAPSGLAAAATYPSGPYPVVLNFSEVLDHFVGLKSRLLLIFRRPADQ